jgi:uncharacterized protein HemX
VNRKGTVAVLVALIIALLATWLWWGRPARQQAAELAAVRAQLAEAEKAATEARAVGERLRGLEAQLQQATDALAKEREARERLQLQLSQLKK